MSDWQPIETAPRDGTWFIGHRSKAPVRDSVEMWAWSSYAQDGNEFYGWVNGRDDNDFFEQPDMWMPHPAPPQGGEK